MLSIPDIPQLNVQIPGLALLRDAIEGVIDEVTSIFDVFDPALSAIKDLTDSLQVLPDSVNAIVDETQTVFTTVSRTAAHWSALIAIVTLVILVLVVNYIFSTMLQDLQRGWSMLRGQV